jgi:hypothetical protein
LEDQRKKETLLFAKVRRSLGICLLTRIERSDERISERSRRKRA